MRRRWFIRSWETGEITNCQKIKIIVRRSESITNHMLIFLITQF